MGSVLHMTIPRQPTATLAPRSYSAFIICMRGIVVPARLAVEESVQRALNHRNSTPSCPMPNYNEEKLHCTGPDSGPWMGQLKIPSRQQSERRVFAYYRLDIGTLAASRRCPATSCEMFIKSTLQQLRCSPFLPPGQLLLSTASLLLQRFMHFFSVCDDVCCFWFKTNATVLSFATPRPAPPDAAKNCQA